MQSQICWASRVVHIRVCRAFVGQLTHSHSGNQVHCSLFFFLAWKIIATTDTMAIRHTFSVLYIFLHCCYSVRYWHLLHFTHCCFLQTCLYSFIICAGTDVGDWSVLVCNSLIMTQWFLESLGEGEGGLWVHDWDTPLGFLQKKAFFWRP